MGESERYLDYKNDKKKSAGAELLQNPLMALVLVHAVFFLALLITRMFFYTTGSTPSDFEVKVISIFSLPSSLNTFIHQPWSIITYIYTDTGETVWRLVSNILWMAAFGFFLLEQQEGDKIIPAYIYGSFFAGFCFVMSSVFSGAPVAGYLSGAQGAVMGLAAAATTYHPAHRFFRHIGRGIPVWTLLILFVFIDLSSVASLPPVYFISHCFAGAAGWAYMYLYKKGTDAGDWMHRFYFFISTIFSPKTKSKRSDIRSRNFYHTGGRPPYKKEIKMNENRMNELLEKIHQQGLDSLTEEEKVFLKKASESEEDESNT